MAPATAFRTEHVAQAPFGWRTRTIVPGPHSRHEVRIAFPPGRRKKGSGRVVEILHPSDERNPRCEISEKAKANPSELLIFGNPNRRGISRLAGGHRPGHQPGCQCFACRAARGEAPSARGKNASRLEQQRQTRERAERIRGARLNPPEMVGDHRGIRMYFEGISYNAPTLKLRGYSTDLALKRAIDRKLKKLQGEQEPGPGLGAYIGKNPKRAELRKRIQKLESQFYPAMDRLAAARRAGGVMSPEYIAIEKETDKLSHDLDLARRQHSAAFNPNNRSEYGKFLPSEKSVATIKTVSLPPNGYYVLKIGDREIGGDSKDRLARYARTQGFTVKVERNPFDWREQRAAVDQGRLIDSIRHGDRVTIVNRFGQQHTGRAVMRSSSGGWVLNMGGPHGTPGLADDRNVVKVRKAKNPGTEDPHAKIFKCPHCSEKFSATQVEAREFTKHMAEHRAKRANPKHVGPKKAKPRKGQSTVAFHQRRVAEILARMPKPIRDVFDRNPVHMQVFFDRGIQKYTAVIYDPKFGNLYASGFTKKQAAKALHDQVRKARSSGTWRNPDPEETKKAVHLFTSFHGRDPKEIVEKHVSAAVRLDYAALGDLEYLLVETPLGKKAKFEFSGDGVKLASSPDGKQLYCIGGNQNLLPCLSAESREKDFIDLGDALQVQYLARKVHGNFQPVSYYHEFGELNGSLPRMMFDKLKKQIFFVGGDYFIDTSEGVSPGIEN